MTLKEAIKTIRARLPENPEKWPTVVPYGLETVDTGCIMQRACKLAGLPEGAYYGSYSVTLNGRLVNGTYPIVSWYDRRDPTELDAAIAKMEDV